MKERGSDREKGSAKSCQPEIKQAGTLPIPEPLHPPQSHILPLHSLYLSATASIFRLFRLSLPLPWQRDIFKSVAALRSRSSLLPHTHTVIPASSVTPLIRDLHVHAAPRLSGRCSSRLIQGLRRAFVCVLQPWRGKLCNSGNNTHRCSGTLGSFLQRNSAYLVKGRCVCGTAGRKYS